MSSRTREKAVPLALVAGCYLLALLQRPGLATSDTKIDLHVDPVGFLGTVASVWSPTGSLGHIQGGQYGGYLWPMGPFYAALHGIGLAPWLVQRLWLGTLLAIAAWGAVRLVDALLGRPRGVAHVVAGALFAINPYVVVFSNRTSITLLGYALLPWLMLVVYRGLRDPRRWWWAAAFGLLVTSTGGGVNAAVTAWLLVGPLLLALYEPLLGGVAWRSVGAFAWRAAAATAATSIWWLVPVVVQAAYGIDFLKFTEQTGSIWSTTSLPESLRLMGYWPSYLGVGYGSRLQSYFGDSGTMLFNPAVVIASLAVPGLALWGFVWTRRWRYGPFCVLLALVALLTMTVGFPQGTPLRHAADLTYDRVQAVQFLRTTYKAGPLLALALACLGGAGAAELWRRLPRARLRIAAAVAATALVVLAALPLFEGRAVELTWQRVPTGWTGAARDLDRTLPRGTRALVLPGQPFAFYRWGGTVDPILPALTDRPVAVRNVPPYDDLHAVDMLWTVDGDVQQQRLLPGELPPLLDLLGARAVITGSDDDVNRSGGMAPAEAAGVLAQQGLDRPARSYGPSYTYEPPLDTLDPTRRLPDVRRYEVPSARPLVRVEPVAPATILDGSAQGVGAAASFGALPPRRPLLYAGDLGPADIRRVAGAGGEVTITDSNRRRFFLASRPRQSFGWTLPASERFSSSAAVLDPFGRGPDAQTVAVYEGAQSVRAPYSPQIPQFAEHRPFAAFDGDPRTSWVPDPTLADAEHWVEVRFDAPRDVPYVDLLPDTSNAFIEATSVAVGGRRFALHPGWNRLRVGLRGVRALRVTITGHRTVRHGDSVEALREVRVPGLRVREVLRPPVTAERALAGRDLSRTPLSYVFERTTADDPLRRAPEPPPTTVTGNRSEDEATLVRTAQDPETGIDRTFSPPAARSWHADAWVTAAPAASDPALDRLAGTTTRGARLASSERLEGRAGWRASSAFDGDRRTAWAAPWPAGRPVWIEWRAPRARRLRRVRLSRSTLPARFPTRVRLSAGRASTPPLTVAADGSVTLPRAVRARTVRLEVLAASGSSRQAVAIGDVTGPGVPRARPARPAARLRGRCGDLIGSVGATGAPATRLALRVTSTVAELDAGAPLRARSCGPPVRMPAGPAVLHVPPSILRPLTLRLSSPARAPVPAVGKGPGGKVLDPGKTGRGSYKGVRVKVYSPSWLVLGESYSRGWRAKCDGRSLGAPQVVDGFANGWRVEPGCHDVSFEFAPQRAVWWGYGIGAVAILVALAFLLLRRSRRGGGGAPAAPLEIDDTPWRLPVRRAVGAGVVAGLVLGFVFALRAGVVIAPAVALLLWRGVSPRALIAMAGGLLAIVVPAIYIVFPASGRHGYDTGYPVELLGAHWVAVAAVTALILALGRTLSTATRPGRRGRATGDRRAARAPA